MTCVSVWTTISPVEIAGHKFLCWRLTESDALVKFIIARLRPGGSRVQLVS